MKKTIYLLLSAVLFLASCASQKIPYKTVPNDEAAKMINHYFDSTSSANHSFLETPKVIGIDKKILKTFTKGGKVEQIKFIVAAYLPGTSTIQGKKNTILLKIIKDNDGKKTFFYYDMRKPEAKMVSDKDDTVCPLPIDCKTEAEN
jgi:hypothetical protein